MIALHAHIGGGPGGEHDIALTALLFLPAAVVAFLVYVDVAARLDVPAARAYLAAYDASGAAVRLAALLLAISATVHMALAPAHAADRPTAVLFLLDAAALTALAIGAVVLPRWRLLTAALLVANLLAYAGYLATGRETADAVGIGTELVEVAALTLVAAPPDASRAFVRKEVFDPMNLSRAYAIAFGVVYTIVGLIGFTVSTTLDTANLIVFPVNVLHNVVHLLVGLLGIAAFLTGRTVLYARVVAVVFAVLTVAGFLPQPLLGLVPLGGLDIVLHAVTAILAAVAGWVYAGRDTVRRATA